MINQNNRLHDDELNNVVGGTVTEFAELYSALKPSGNSAIAHLPAFNSKAAKEVTQKLAAYGIKANIDLGLLGTGTASEANRYTIDGKPASHQDVLNRIKELNIRL